MCIRDRDMFKAATPAAAKLLIKTIDAVSYTHLDVYKRQQCGYVQVVDVGDIEDAPAVDAAPVVHGRWGEYESFSLTPSMNGCPCSCLLYTSTLTLVWKVSYTAKKPLHPLARITEAQTKNLHLKNIPLGRICQMPELHYIGISAAFDPYAEAEPVSYCPECGAPVYDGCLLYTSRCV